MIHIGSTKNKSRLSVIDETMVCPNAVDIRIDRLFAIEDDKFFTINEEEKIHRGSVEMKTNDDGYWCLHANSSYEFLAEGKVTMGDDEAGWVITRSTLNRNGLFITSGLYDSGYSGVMAGVIHNNSGPAFIKKGTRIGQFLLFKAEVLKQYDGDYGSGKMDEVLYKK